MSAGGSKGTVETVRELWALLKSYAIQETVTPFKSLGRSLGWGLVGAVLVCAAVVFSALSLLRLLQTETAVFADRLSWLAYLIVAVAMGVVMGLAAMGIARSRRSAGQRPTSTDTPLSPGGPT